MQTFLVGRRRRSGRGRRSGGSVTKRHRRQEVDCLGLAVANARQAVAANGGSRGLNAGEHSLGSVQALHRVVEANQKVAAIVGVRRAERDRHGLARRIKRALVYHGGTAHALKVSKGRSSNLLQENLNVAVVPRAGSPRADTELELGNLALNHVYKVGGGLHELHLLVAVDAESVDGNKCVLRRAVIHYQSLCAHHAHKGKHAHHHQRKYFLLHNE